MYICIYVLFFNIICTTEKFPSNPSVLAHAGAYFNFMRDFETAEKMFVGALLVSPQHDGALLGFAHFFADAALRVKGWVRVTNASEIDECMWQANLTSAEKFLKKIDSKSPYSLMAKIETVWLREIRFIFFSYKFICMYTRMYVYIRILFT